MAKWRPFWKSSGSGATTPSRSNLRLPDQPAAAILRVRSAGGDPALAEHLGDAASSHGPGGRGSLGLVIVNYGSAEMIAENLPAEVAADAAATVVIVDNLSSEAERTRVRELVTDRGWELVESPVNAGFGAGVNAGVLRAAQLGCDVCITLNPDARASAEVLSELVAEVLRDSRQIVSPAVVRPDGSPFFRGSTVSIRTGQIRAGEASETDPEWINWLSGACLAFSTETFAELQGFADEYFLYWEDVDLSVRAVSSGIGLHVRRDLAVVHEEGGTHSDGIKQGGKSPVYYYYNTRNRLLFGSRLAPSANRWAWLVNTPRESIRIWLRGGRRQLFTNPRGVGAAVRGTVAGLLTYLPALRSAG